MQRFVRRKKPPLPGRRPARWTPLEIGMLALAVLLIVFPLYAEAYRWANPLAAPAAPRQQTDATAAGEPAPAAAPQQTDPTAASAPTPAAAVPQQTDPTAANDIAPQRATDTAVASTPSGPTATQTSATDTPTGPSATPTTPTDTPTGPSATPPPPTDTPLPGTSTPTLTPIPNEPPLRLVKSASASLAPPGGQFNYTLSVFSNSTSASQVVVRDSVDGSLQIISTAATKGSCTSTSNTVSCTVTAQNNQPVTINIVVQVRSSAAKGSRISNQAVAQDDRNFTAPSDQVVVDIGTQPVPTSAPTTPPGGNTAVPPSTPTGPTAVPTATSTSGSKPSGSSRRRGSSESEQPTLEVPPLPPIPQPGAVLLAPTPRPGRPPAQPGVTTARARTTTPAPLVPIATSPPATTPAETGTFFRMASDWGSQFVGQEINYVIAFRNTRASDPINNLVISSDLPENLEILGRKADRGDPQIQGNTLTLKLDTLKAGQGVEIAVRTKIKDSVQVGTRILSQATASFDGLAVPLSSNVVTVLIVGADQSTAQPLIQAGSPTATASATATSAPSPTATETATATAEPATVAPQAASAPTVAPIAGQSPDLSAAPLPETSAGVPISGFLLLGLTLLLRTVRLHRAQSRI